MSDGIITVILYCHFSSVRVRAYVCVFVNDSLVIHHSVASICICISKSVV